MQQQQQQHCFQPWWTGQTRCENAARCTGDLLCSEFPQQQAGGRGTTLPQIGIASRSVGRARTATVRCRGRAGGGYPIYIGLKQTRRFKHSSEHHNASGINTHRVFPPCRFTLKLVANRWCRPSKKRKKEHARQKRNKSPASPNQKKLLALPGQQVLSYERSSRSSPSTRNWRPLGHRWRATIASSTLHWTGARNGPTPGRSVLSSVLSLAPSEPTRALQKKRHRTVRAHRRKRPITGAYPIRPA